MAYSYYIFKPNFVDFLELSNSYIIINGGNQFFSIPKFFSTKSLLPTAKNALFKLKKTFKTSFQILSVKGIGFKVYYYPKDHSLYLNLGYNHLCRYKLTKNIGVKVRKQYILLYALESFVDLILPAYEIRALRSPDPYRGKGIRFRSQEIKFKPGKQR